MEARAQIIVVGAGLAGLSAALYLARAKREVLVVDSGKSMARWEPKVENYLGFPSGISGRALLERGRRQARRYGARLRTDLIQSARRLSGGFWLVGKRRAYSCQRLLLATGAFHIPPDFSGFTPCLGRSIFFCKDCDGYRVQGKRIAVYGWSNETVVYAVALLSYACEVCVLTDGREPAWDGQHAEALQGRRIPAFRERILRIRRQGAHLRGVVLQDGSEKPVEAIFITRGDVIWNALGKELGARLDQDGQIITDLDMRTSVKDLYAAGCVTPANCQMIIAAGQGATAAQAINRDLFCETLWPGRARSRESHDIVGVA